MDKISPYYDLGQIETEVRRGEHRETVGGLWEEVGELQLGFLLRNGLRPDSIVLDIGCGCLRCGVRLIEYLDAECYFGVDISQALLDAGYDSELEPRGLQDKLPRKNLVCCGDFDFEQLDSHFDIAIAQSLCTHLQEAQIRLCLGRLFPKMNREGRLFATFFLVPETHPVGMPYEHPHGIVSFDDKDPYHYRFSQLRQFCEKLPWVPLLVGQWDHPRDQQMVLFYMPDEHGGAATRDLSAGEADQLPAGAEHYRPYVGPSDRYDFMSASQFTLLFTLGLREHHSVLDFGCGSLRLGRLLIPFLQPQSYFGIDPNRWLVEDGIKAHVGHELIGIKLPSFSFTADFACDVFGRKFDYIVAQSILTHTGPDLAARLLAGVSETLAAGGKFIFSICEAEDFFESPSEQGWVYPHCLNYGRLQMRLMCRRAGLHCRRLPWYHPGAAWYVAAHEAADLPSVSELWLLRGAVLFDPQFEASRAPKRM